MKYNIFLCTLICVSFFSCSKDDPAPGSKLNHVGDKWIITSVDYTIVDQNLSNPSQWFKNGTATNAGAFYFNGSEGSFDIVIDKNHQEDYFGFTQDGSEISIVTIDQNLSGTKVSQSIIAISGEAEATSMTLSGTFTRQNLAQQYVFTGSFVLTKE